MGRIFRVLLLIALVMLVIYTLFGKKRQNQIREWVSILAISLLISGTLMLLWRWIRWF